MPSAEEQILLDYYSQSADRYDDLHLERSEHNVALHFLSGILSELRVGSVLDAACGTGRGWLYLKPRHPRMQIRNTDLSVALVKQAISKGVPEESFDISNATHLPYRENAFDFAVEFGALHHMIDPEGALREMLRVARIGIALSDTNVYALGLGIRGPLASNILGAVIKLALCRSGLWNPLKTLVRGRRYSISEGDGLSYAYSIFESVRLLRKLCNQVYVIPIAGTRHKETLPILSAYHCLVVALKSDQARLFNATVESGSA